MSLVGCVCNSNYIGICHKSEELKGAWEELEADVGNDVNTVLVYEMIKITILPEKSH